MLTSLLARRLRTAAATLLVSGSLGCVNGPAVITQQVEARRLAARVHVNFIHANEASNRAVMADTDEASESAARESGTASAAAAQDLEQLGPLLQSLSYKNEIETFGRASLKFEEYRKLDAEILPLAVANTNLKAQQLSFTAGREAAESLFAVLATATGVGTSSAEAAVESANCRVAVLTIQVLQGRHIAEAEDGMMTRIEAEMTTAEQAARTALEHLRRSRPAAATASLAEASDALDRFLATNRQIIALSRRNTNVRSLALALGRKRVVAAECDDQLQALEDALASHAFAATR